MTHQTFTVHIPAGHLVGTLDRSFRYDTVKLAAPVIIDDATALEALNEFRYELSDGTVCVVNAKPLTGSHCEVIPN